MLKNVRLRRRRPLGTPRKRLPISGTRVLFYIAYPIGLLAFLIGGFVNLRADSLGLMYGGILTLAGGCYNNWDNMNRWIRFDALVISLIAILVCGYFKFRPDDVKAPPSAPRPQIES